MTRAHHTPLDLSKSYMLILEGLHSRPAYRAITPGKILDSFVSKKVLGVTLDATSNRTTFRLFAPQTSDVELCFYAGPEFRSQKTDELIPPKHVHEMVRDDDGVWETVLPGLLTGAYYAFRVDSPSGPGEAFKRRQPIGDPHSRAVAHARNASIVIDPNEQNKWFGGWTDEAYRPPRLEDVVVYETHVRDLTLDASSGVEKSKRGRYEGITASLGTGTGLDQLKRR